MDDSGFADADSLSVTEGFEKEDSGQESNFSQSSNSGIEISYDTVDSGDDRSGIDQMECQSNGKRKGQLKKLENAYCCVLMCLTVLISTALDECLLLNQLYSDLTRQEKKQWAMDYLNLHKRRLVNGAFEYVYMVGARSVCLTSWISILGLPLSSFYKIRSLADRGVMVIDQSAGRAGMLACKTYSAMVWLSGFANKYGDRLPDRSKIQLPMCATRLSVYEQMKEDQDDDDAISYSHFLKIWRRNFYYIIIPKVSRFSKCDMCILIKQKLQTTTDKVAREDLKKQRHTHLVKQSEQRQKYYKHCSKAKNNPDKYLSLIIDGMDQNKTCIPHMVSESKAVNQMWKLKVHLTGIIVHGVGTFGYFDYNQVKHDSNLTITVLLKTLLLLPKLPRTLYIQMDNCGRENKNRFVLGFLTWLVLNNIFKKVKVGFLMVGHTHEDVDRVFSSFSRKLVRNDALTIPHLMSLWHDCQTPAPAAYRLDRTFDFAAWMSPYLYSIEGHSKPHAYKICRNEIGDVVLLWKAWPTDAEWNYCSGIGGPGILAEIPEGLPSSNETSNPTTDRLKLDILKNKKFFRQVDIDWWTGFFEDISEDEVQQIAPIQELFMMEKAHEVTERANRSDEVPTDDDDQIQVTLKKRRKTNK